jgi:hypothetical protein
MTCVVGATFAAEDTSDHFHDVLATAGLGPEVLAKLVADAEYDLDDWQVISQLVYRLRQFPAGQLQRWVHTGRDEPGDLAEIVGTVEQVEPVLPPGGLSDESPLPTLYRCRYDSGEGADGIVLVPQIPEHWQGRAVSSEPVQALGVQLGTTAEGERLLVADRLAWFPQAGVPPGWLLLARQGMDVSLLDEVRHRQPFVKPDVSREGEAFYQCLAALSNVDPQELARLTLENVAAVSEAFRETIPTDQQRVAELRRQSSAVEDPLQREALQQQLAAARRELALAEAVEKQGQQGLSSVAPMFLQPEDQVGEFVRIEGIARRAVRIAVMDSDSRPPGLDAYYELEVFTPDSQNLPVVCCVAQLPAEFSLGDVIREPVRVDGVFFKSWRYRSRKNLADAGQTDRPQQLYTPVVVGGEPHVLPAPAGVDSRWGIWGGIAFLAALAAIWIAMLGVAERDRQRRAAQQPDYLENLPEGR